MINLNAGKAKLAFAMKSLMLHWDDTKGSWNDPVSKAFEEEYLEPLEPKVAVALRGIERLNQILVSAEQECS